MRTIAAAMFLVIPVVAALGGFQDEKIARRDARVMVVTGCIDHSWLTVRKIDTSGTVVDRYRLHGNKDVMKALTKDNNRHLVEVTGTLTDPDNTQGRGKTIQIGDKTTITTSGRDLPKPREMKRDPILDVTSFKVVENNCR